MKQYQYLVYSLIFVIVFGIALRLRKDLRPHILLPCIAGAFIGPLSELFYFRDYWHPYTLFGQAVPGIEDVLFGASVIGLTLLAYPLIFNKQEWQARHKRHIAISLTYLAVGSVLLLFLNARLGINSIVTTGIVCLTLLIPILAARPDLAKPALLTGLIMATLSGTVYFILLGFIFKDALHNVWLLDNTRLGIKVFGYVPVTELVWFFTVGTFLEAFDMYVSETHFRKMRRRPSVKRLRAQRAKG